MKKQRFFLILLLMLVLLVASCSSTKTLVKQITSGLPLWYQIPALKTGKNQISFRGLAEEETERQAELVAKQNLINSVCDYLGVEPRQEQFREFVQNGTVEHWGLTLKESYHAQHSGSYVDAFLATADLQTLQKNMSEERIQQNEDKQAVVDLVLEGDSHIKAGEDITGIECYIRSMALSFNNPPDDPQYSFENILNEVMDILESTRMKISKANTPAATCSITVQRKETLLYEDIALCPLKASYLASNGSGNVFSDDFTYLTNKKGTVDFVIMNNNALRKGSVLFEYDLDSALQALQKVAPKTAEYITGIIKEKSIQFNYDREFKMGDLGLVVYEFSQGFIYNPQSKAFDRINTMFLQDGTQVVPFESTIPVQDDDSADADIAAEFFEKNPQLNSFLIIRAGVVGTSSDSAIAQVVAMEGRAVIYTRNGSIVYDSGVVGSTGFGSDYDAAADDASDRLCRKIYSLVKGSYV